MDETDNLWKNNFLCPPVFLIEFAISQHRRKITLRAKESPEQLSITARETHKLLSNCQTRQRWSNKNQDSVTVMPVSLLKMFSEIYYSVLFSCKIRKFAPASGWCWVLVAFKRDQAVRRKFFPLILNGGGGGGSVFGLRLSQGVPEKKKKTQLPAAEK